MSQRGQTEIMEVDVLLAGQARECHSVISQKSDNGESLEFPDPAAVHLTESQSLQEGIITRRLDRQDKKKEKNRI